MVIVASLVNMKGGVGKSTVCSNLAVYAAQKKKLNVLVVDLDPQSNVSHYLLGEMGYVNYIKSGGGTVLEIFEQFTPPTRGMSAPKPIDQDEIIKNVRKWMNGGRLDLIPSRLELSWTLRNPTGKDHLLAQFLAQFQEKNGYDLILIDCPPTESILTWAAYRASGKIIVPIKPEFLATIGLPLLARSVNEFQIQHTDQHIEITGIVFNDTDPSRSKKEHNKARNDVKKLAAKNNWHVFENEIRHSDSFLTGARSGKAIFNTDNARWWVVDEVNECLDEILGCLRL